VRPSTLVLLARPRSLSELSRVKLVTAVAATDGALVLCCARIARIRGDDSAGGLAPYVAESGLRAGTVLGGLLLCVPLAALCVQSLRVGASAQARSLAALRLAGATPGDVRRLSGAQSAGAAGLGGLLAGPLYLGLSVALGAALPRGWRLLPPPDVADVGTWLAVVFLLIAAGGLAGVRVQREAITHPLAAARRSAPRLGTRRRGVVLCLCVCALVLSQRTFFSRSSSLAETVALFASAISLLVCAFVIGPWAVLLVARVLHRRGTATSVMAAARLAAEPRGPGRVFSVLLICSLAFRFDLEFALSLLQDQYDVAFYLTGVGLVASGIFLAAVVAILTLTVGAADQLLDARRALACLSGLGVSRAVLVRAMRRQLLAASLPGAVLGPCLALVYPLIVQGPLVLRHPVILVEPAALSAGTSVVLVTVTVLAALLAARLLESQLTAALDPANLRAP
jgi:hypothetical protein